MRFSGTGPRSLTRTKIDLRFFRLVTRSHVPRGRLRCAQVRAFMSYDSPFAVCLPWKYRPYQDAVPIWSQRRTLLDCTGVDFASGALAGVGEPASLADAVTPSATRRVAMAAPRREGICLSPIIVEKIFTATSS